LALPATIHDYPVTGATESAPVGSSTPQPILHTALGGRGQEDKHRTYLWIQTSHKHSLNVGQFKNLTPCANHKLSDNECHYFFNKILHETIINKNY
jgi:hypothetical protein